MTEYFFYNNVTLQDVKDKTDIVWEYDEYGQPWFSMTNVDGLMQACPKFKRGETGATGYAEGYLNDLSRRFTLMRCGYGPGNSTAAILHEICHKLGVRVVDENTDEDLYRLRCEKTMTQEVYDTIEPSVVDGWMDANGFSAHHPYDPAAYHTTAEERAEWAAMLAREEVVEKERKKNSPVHAAANADYDGNLFDGIEVVAEEISDATMHAIEEYFRLNKF